MATLTYTLVPIVPLVVWLLMVAWSPTGVEGQMLYSVPIPLLARAKMLVLPFTLGVLFIGAVAILDDAHWLSVPLLLVAFTIVICVPIRYTLTTVGIRAGKGQFRRWTEFAGVRRSANGAILQGGPRSSSYPIFLSGNREDDEFLLTLKNLILDSYKGTGQTRDRLRSGVRQR